MYASPDRSRSACNIRLIGEVHRALAGLGRAAPAQEPREPAVPIRRSVQQVYVICLECGYHAEMLRRHLRVAHGLEAADCRTRWQLPRDYPLTAPGYSARRSTLAKAIGLGRHDAEPSTPTTKPRQQRSNRRTRLEHHGKTPGGVVAGRGASHRHDVHNFGRAVRDLAGPGPQSSR
jgi:predicted transcriptional regulator